MTSTWFLISLFSVLLVVSIVLQTGALKWGLRWKGIADLSSLKAFLYWLLLFVVGTVVAGFILIPFPDRMMVPPAITFCALALAVQFIVSAALVAKLFRASFSRSLQAVCPLTGVSLAMTAFAILVIRPYVYEAFYIPTNAMAPTILGEHWEAPCPRCGHPAYGSALVVPESDRPKGQQMICSSELRPCDVTEQTGRTINGDHILVNKLLTPRRWDIIVFRFPDDPSMNYVKRLVGLPGEEVVIRDGAVWIDGQRLDPPESIAGIQYTDAIDRWPHTIWGHESNPAKLGPGEYFVLGDFSAQSADSRLWETGAPGHPPYAVPESHILGVVTHIYWPNSRWRTFR